jgi:uroporphyrinogen decarboxylase
MTSKERFARILKRQPVDRVGLFEVFWRETARKWSAEGHFEKPELVSDHFGLDVRRTGGEITPGDYRTLNLLADVDAGEELVEETDTTRLVRDGNGALLRWRKDRSGGPEHVGFRVEDRRGWEEQIQPRLRDERTYERRIKFEAYRDLRAKCAGDQRFMTCAVVGAFDLMSPMCGHENLLMGMAADGGWVRGMADTYADITLRLLEILFEREG